MIEKNIPLVSVVIPAYNVEKFIRETVMSALAQSYQNVEVIVVNDGSTDDTQAILASIKDSRLKVLNTKNSGVSAARNLGIEQSAGEWVAFLDGDDLWITEKLEKQMSFVSEDVAWSHTDSIFVGKNQVGTVCASDLSEMAQGEAFDKLLICNTITTSTVIAKKSLLMRAGLFRTDLASLEDWDLWLKMARLEPIGFLKESLTKYLVHDNSATRKDLSLTLRDHMQFIQRVYSEDGVAHDKRQHMNKTMLKSYDVLCYVAEAQNQRMFSLKIAAKMLALKPLGIQVWRRIFAIAAGYLKG